MSSSDTADAINSPKPADNLVPTGERYFDELEIGEWLLARGMDPDARAAIDGEGFGGYTALFSTVVSQGNFWVNYGNGQPDEARFTRLLLDRGADPNAHASLRHRLEPGHSGGPLREYRDVTPLGWGEGFIARSSSAGSRCG